MGEEQKGILSLISDFFQKTFGLRNNNRNITAEYYRFFFIVIKRCLLSEIIITLIEAAKIGR